MRKCRLSQSNATKQTIESVNAHFANTPLASLLFAYSVEAAPVCLTIASCLL
jgi:hypothetical protein